MNIPTPRDVLTHYNNLRLAKERAELEERMRIARLRAADASRMASIEGSPESFNEGEEGE